MPLFSTAAFRTTRRKDAAEAFLRAQRAAAGLRERLGADSRDGETIVAGLENEFCRDELTLYSRESITNCCRLPLRRSLEEESGC